MKNFYFFVVIFTITILIILSSGCINQHATPTGNISPNVTESKILIPVIITSNATTDDKIFIDATEACYRETPEINNSTNHRTFINCMQNAPEPVSVCEKEFKHIALKYTNEDDTTAGYSRMNYNMQLLRNAYFNNLTWNGTTQKFESCA
jgi:hypothetical protein